MINITDSTARQLYQQENERQMQILENVHIGELKPVLNRQYIRSAQAVQQGMLDIDFAVDKDNDRLISLLVKHYKRIAAVFGEKVFKAMEEAQKSIAIPEIKGPKEEFWGELNRWMSTEAGRKIRHIQDTTKRNIARTIRKGMEEGESHRTIAKRVRKTGRISTVRRAVTIARTETHTASVKSVDAGIKSTRILMEKEWVSARDDRTRSRIRKDRFEHYLKFPAGPDGEKVAQDGKFTKTGEALDYPGDPAGSAANVISCRCVLLYKPVNRMDKLKPYKPEPGYVPAKTVEGAEKWVKNNGLAENVLYSGGRAWGGKLSKKEALEKFNVVNKEITDFQTKQGIKLPKVKNLYITSSGRGSANYTLPASESSISFAQEWTAKNWDSAEKWSKTHNRPWNWKRAEPHTAYNVRHEYAHILDGEFGITKSEAFTTMQRRVFKIDKFPSTKISDYASKKGRLEWFAEAFAEYTSPLYDNRFPKRLEKFLDSILDKMR